MMKTFEIPLRQMPQMEIVQMPAMQTFQNATDASILNANRTNNLKATDSKGLMVKILNKRATDKNTKIQKSTKLACFFAASTSSQV